VHHHIYVCNGKPACGALTRGRLARRDRSRCAGRLEPRRTNSASTPRFCSFYHGSCLLISSPFRTFDPSAMSVQAQGRPGRQALCRIGFVTLVSRNAKRRASSTEGGLRIWLCYSMGEPRQLAAHPFHPCDYGGPASSGGKLAGMSTSALRTGRAELGRSITMRTSSVAPGSPAMKCTSTSYVYICGDMGSV